MAEAPAPDRVVDCLGRACPVPVIELARAVAGLPVGAVVEIHSDDPAAGYDIPAWCRLRGQRYAGAHPIPSGTGYLVVKVV